MAALAGATQHVPGGKSPELAEALGKSPALGVWAPASSAAYWLKPIGQTPPGRNQQKTYAEATKEKKRAVKVLGCHLQV